MPSSDDLLFAEHVVKCGFLTQEEVDESLSVQRRMEEMGVKDSIRNVLVKRGALREADAAIVARNAGLRTGGEPIPGYSLEARLGTGAMGSVYKAWQKGMKRHVAIKILRRDLTDDPRQVERLQREAALVGKLDHPNIVRGLDTGETDGLVWFVMELVDGETLRARITRLGRIDHEEAVHITRLLAEALQHAATHGVVHRDVKPGNILVAKDGTPRLTDYGLAKGESDDALTQLDATLGTPQYISPEQARNPRDADIRSDMYSLGATLYAMLTGGPPFAGETMAATLTKVLYERPKPLSLAAPDAPPALAYVVERMMAKDRRHRYQTPAELLHDLRALEEGRLVVPSGFKGDISEFVETRRHRRLWLVGAGLMAAAVALASGVYAWERRAEQQRRLEAAEQELASIRKRVGPQDDWDGATVEKMLKDLESFEREHAGTPAAEEAINDLGRWTTEEIEAKRANDLAKKADDPGVAWPKLVDEIARRTEALRGLRDASVARRRLAKLQVEVHERRDRHAEAESSAAKSSVTEVMTLAQAARRFDALADTLRKKYFGAERSVLIDTAAATAESFRKADAALDRHFAEYEALAAKEGPARDEFRTRELKLERAGAAATDDDALARLLATLPPPGTRTRVVANRRAELRAALEKDSAAAWEKVRRAAEERKTRGDYDGAAVLLSQFASRALDKESDSALEMREKLVELKSGAQSMVKRMADDTAAGFFAALGERDYEKARTKLDDLAAAQSANSPSNGPAAELVESGRRLLELIDSKLWRAFQARLASGAPLEGGLRVRRGQGNITYQVRDVKVDGGSLEFTSESGEPWRGRLYDVELDDVIRYSGLTAGDADRALVLAAVRLTDDHLPSDPIERLKALAATTPQTDMVAGVPALRSMAGRLSKLRSDLADAARAEIAKSEESARGLHEQARTALELGRFEAAWRQLKSLLERLSYSRTEYVKRNRDDIVKERDTADLGRRTSSVAAHYPGGVFKQAADKSGELFYDFESLALAEPDAKKALGLVEGRIEIGSRPVVVADFPGVVRPNAPPAAPYAIEHVLTWRPADQAYGPRDVPLSIALPFSMRKEISVSFLYRSDTPFFLAVAIGGVAVEVPSAPDEPYGGRGVKIWNAADLDRPDKVFDDRHRTSYLAKNKDLVKEKGSTRYFCFEPGRTYRVEFVKGERKASFFVDGELREEVELRPSSVAVGGPLDGRVTLVSFSAGDVDDLRIAGILN